MNPMIGLLSKSFDPQQQQMNPIGLLGLALMNNSNNDNRPNMMNLMMQMAMQKMEQNNQMPNQSPPQISQTNDIINNMMHPNVTNDASRGSPIDRIMYAIGKFESGGRYNATGPITKSGDRAFGRYQIMGNNIGPWSQDALGRRVTTEEFLNNPQLQDQIARHRMQQYYNKYQDPRQVASMWFSGRPMQNNFSKDVLGTSVPVYIKNVMKYF